MKATLLLVLTTLSAGCSARVVQIFTFDHRSTSYDGSAVEKEKKITRVKFSGGQARIESDFELYLVNERSKEFTSIERIERTFHTAPLVPLPTCPPIQQLLEANHCQLTKPSSVLPDRLSCKKNDMEDWSATGSRKAGSSALLRALYSSELLSPELYCLLQGLPFDFTELRVRDARDPHDHQVWELKRTAVTETPYDRRLFEPPEGFVPK